MCPSLSLSLSLGLSLAFCVAFPFKSLLNFSKKTGNKNPKLLDTHKKREPPKSFGFSLQKNRDHFCSKMSSLKFRAAFRAKVDERTRGETTTTTTTASGGGEEGFGTRARPLMRVSADDDALRWGGKRPRPREETTVQKEGRRDVEKKASLPAGFFDEANEEEADGTTKKRRSDNADVGGSGGGNKKQKTANTKTVADETSSQEFLKQKEEEERIKREEEEAAMHAKELADEVIADTVAGFDKVDALRKKAMEVMKKKKKEGGSGEKNVSQAKKDGDKDDESSDDDSDDDDDFAWRRKKKSK